MSQLSHYHISVQGFAHFPLQILQPALLIKTGRSTEKERTFME